MNFIHEYREAFLSTYPQHTLEIKPVKRKHEPTRYKVIISGDAGNITLSKEQMEEATTDFNRGKHR